MNNEYKRIPGNAVYSKDGQLLLDIIQDVANIDRICEVGTFYARHAVLWSSILASKGIECDYITIDEQNYLGSWDAQIIAKENLRKLAPNVKTAILPELDKDSERIKELLDYESAQIISLDMEYNPSKLARMLSTWHQYLSVGGYLKWYVSNLTCEQDEDYKKTVQDLQDYGFVISSSEDIRFAKKTKSSKHTAKQNRSKESVDLSNNKSRKEVE
jgi:hypothetical protein